MCVGEGEVNEELDDASVRFWRTEHVQLEGDEPCEAAMLFFLPVAFVKLGNEYTGCIENE